MDTTMVYICFSHGSNVANFVQAKDAYIWYKKNGGFVYRQYTDDNGKVCLVRWL
jgi:hypothetical protein